MKKLSLKIILIAVSISLIISLILTAATVISLQDLAKANINIHEQELNKRFNGNLLHEVEVAASAINHFYTRYERNELSLVEAKSEALKAAKAFTYGGVSGEFFIISTDGTCLLYRNNSSLEGTNVLNYQTQDGQLMFKELIDAAQKGNTLGGFVDVNSEFMKGGETETTPARVVGLQFKKFDWIICTHDYMDVFQTNAEVFDLKSQEVLKAKILLMSIVSALFLVLAAITSIFIGRKITKPIIDITKASTQLASGDLTFKSIQVKSKDETRSLAESFNRSIESIREMVKESKNISEQVTKHSSTASASMKELGIGTSQIAETMQEIVVGINKQAESTDNINSKAGTILSDIMVINQEMTESSDISLKTKHTVEEGKATLEFQKNKMTENKKASDATYASISNLSSISDEIATIINVIEGISSQTTLLALNASIEAARAGEHGKGFAVVADEIRKLADETVNSTQKITSIIGLVNEAVKKAMNSINTSKKTVHEQEESMESTSAVFEQIVNSAQKAYDVAIHVRSSTEALTGQFKDINEDIADIASISQETAAAIQEVSATTEEQSSSFDEINNIVNDLYKMTEILNDQINKFKLMD